MIKPFGDCSGPFVIGHRGAAGYAPENTMAAFERGISLRADAIELDINLAKDGELMVIHDPTLNRTTNGKGLVCQHTAAEIQALDAGSWFDSSFRECHVPTLREVLSWAKDRTKVVIEIKNGPIFYPDIEKILVALLDELHMRNQVLAISFDHLVLRDLKKLAPDVATGVIYASRVPDPAGMAQAVDADVLMPYWALLTREEVAQAHAADMFISPWGGAEQDYKHLLALGVDAVGADFPDRPREFME